MVLETENIVYPTGHTGLQELHCCQQHLIIDRLTIFRESPQTQSFPNCVQVKEKSMF